MTPRPRSEHLVASAAHLFMFDADGRLLVIRRNTTGYLDGYWSVPAGHIDAGETAAQACAREALEEVGLRMDPARLRFELVQQKTAADGEARIDFFFSCDLRPGDEPTVAAPREVDRVAWAPPGDLPQPFAPYVTAALRARARGRAYETWGFETDAAE
jgi:8-oxo-dGTP pyrophosphatase MutT (NUDIX family)